MKGKYGGPIAVNNLFQALYEDKVFFDEHGILYLKGVYLYFTPCDHIGQAVAIRDKWGRPIVGYASTGGYHSAAEAYEREPARLSPIALLHSTDS